MAQNGTFSCAGDTMLDETGAEELLLAVVLQAARDLKRRNTPACYRRDAAEFLGYLGVSGDKLQEVANIMAQAKVDEAVTQTDSLLRDFEELNERADRLLQSTQPDAPRRQAAPAPVASPFQDMDAARLDALGVSTQWANMTSEQYAELERRQRHAARAAALGVLPQYLPEAEE